MISLRLAKLANRKLLRISGPDCYPYLQGLLCNDLRYLYEPDRIPARKHARNSPTTMSTFMVNAQGRAICDIIVYRTPMTRYKCEFTPPGQATEHDELLLECDSTLASGLANTLFGYRVRRKISLNLENDLSVWSLFPKLSSEIEFTDETSLIDMKQFETTEVLNEQLTLVADPRLTQMGMRIISREPNIESVKRSLESIVKVGITEASHSEYTLHRYQLGVGEGLKDHPESNCLPLECNADFLGSVSFNKGCYLGQELTARIHHTGVVRKRLMPIVLEVDLRQHLQKQQDGQNEQIVPLVNGSDIIDAESKKKVGILRHVLRDRGLALLRHQLALNSSNLIHEGTKLKLSTYKPYWWGSIGH